VQTNEGGGGPTRTCQYGIVSSRSMPGRPLYSTKKTLTAKVTEMSTG
jgi:hypothetical protein